MLYFAFVRSKLEYASVAWNSATITDSNKLERIQRKFAALWHRFFQDVEYHCDNLLEKLNLLTLHIKRRHADALFVIHVFSSAKCCPSVHETAAFVFLLGTYVTLPCSVAPPATALQLDMCLLQMQYVNLQISLEAHV
jgi:hypothetical protein